MSSSAASSPVEDWTALTATTSMLASTASASSSSATSLTVTPRSACARNGNSSDVNSGSAASTLAPSGTAAATCPISPETVAPTAMCSGRTRTSVANSARARSVTAVQCSQLTRPARQSACAALSASNAGSGGRPKLAVFRYVVSGCQRSGITPGTLELDLLPDRRTLGGLELGFADLRTGLERRGAAVGSRGRSRGGGGRRRRGGRGGRVRAVVVARLGVVAVVVARLALAARPVVVAARGRRGAAVVAAGVVAAAVVAPATATSVAVVVRRVGGLPALDPGRVGDLGGQRPALGQRDRQHAAGERAHAARVLAAVAHAVVV